VIDEVERLGMIAAVALRLLYLIFQQVLGLVLLMGRTSPSMRYDWPAPATSPLAYATTPATADDPWPPTRSHDDFAGP
jgi:hypothetical protein